MGEATCSARFNLTRAQQAHWDHFRWSDRGLDTQAMPRQCLPWRLSPTQLEWPGFNCDLTLNNYSTETDSN